MLCLKCYININPSDCRSFISAEFNKYILIKRKYIPCIKHFKLFSKITLSLTLQKGGFCSFSPGHDNFMLFQCHWADAEMQPAGKTDSFLKTSRWESAYSELRGVCSPKFVEVTDLRVGWFKGARWRTAPTDQLSLPTDNQVTCSALCNRQLPRDRLTPTMTRNLKTTKRLWASYHRAGN